MKIRGLKDRKARKLRASMPKPAERTVARQSDVLPLPKVGDIVRTEYASGHGRKLAEVRDITHSHGETTVLVRFVATGIKAKVPLSLVSHAENGANRNIELVDNNHTPYAEASPGAPVGYSFPPPSARAETRSERVSRLETWKLQPR